MKRLLCGLLAALMLCGCAAFPVGTTVPVTTIPATTGVPETTVPATTGPVLNAGFYVPVNPDLAAMLFYIQLLEDGSGLFCSMGAPHVAVWTPEGGSCAGMPIVPTADGLILDEGEYAFNFNYTGEALPDDYLPTPPAPGVYAVSSMAVDGDVDFYGRLSRDNGYFELKEDGTGVLVFNDTEYPFTMEGATAHFDGWRLTLLDMSDQDTGGEPMVMVYVMDGPIRADSIAFRKMEE